MANAIYPKYKEALLSGSSNTGLNGTVNCTLVTGDYTYSATDEFITAIDAGYRIDTVALDDKTFTNGTFDADNVQYTSVTGSEVTAIVIWIDTGVEATSRLVAYIDTDVTNLPVTPNGGDILITWNASGIFTL
ncbi:MAG: hypothetical protein AMQ22_00937 [Candidatus Methanofastidiosum methylothiophilum]|uniref:Uncharacterized protein n=1 Tax=Candidatus Methanofastidiosum methylothiophilum TaxID=1705564 RepID=A0A150J4R5_9EURY|nr:MAG: hypothetical protein AMQ22_00937 [Candidatus Methanofastidiosum methylthiophilus]